MSYSNPCLQYLLPHHSLRHATAMQCTFMLRTAPIFLVLRAGNQPERLRPHGAGRYRSRISLTPALSLRERVIVRRV